MRPRQALAAELDATDDDEFTRIFVGETEYTSLADVPNGEVREGLVTAYSDQYVFYTEVHDTWPDQIKHIPRNPDDYQAWHNAQH